MSHCLSQGLQDWPGSRLCLLERLALQAPCRVIPECCHQASVPSAVSPWLHWGHRHRRLRLHWGDRTNGTGHTWRSSPHPLTGITRGTRGTLGTLRGHWAGYTQTHEAMLGVRCAGAGYTLRHSERYSGYSARRSIVPVGPVPVCDHSSEPPPFLRQRAPTTTPNLPRAARLHIPACHGGAWLSRDWAPPRRRCRESGGPGSSTSEVGRSPSGGERGRAGAWAQRGHGEPQRGPGGSSPLLREGDDARRPQRGRAAPKAGGAGAAALPGVSQPTERPSRVALAPRSRRCRPLGAAEHSASGISAESRVAVLAFLLFVAGETNLNSSPHPVSWLWYSYYMIARCFFLLVVCNICNCRFH